MIVHLISVPIAINLIKHSGNNVFHLLPLWSKRASFDKWQWFWWWLFRGFTTTHAHSPLIFSLKCHLKSIDFVCFFISNQRFWLGIWKLFFQFHWLRFWMTTMKKTLYKSRWSFIGMMILFKKKLSFRSWWIF